MKFCNIKHDGPMYPIFYDDAPYLRRDLTVMPIKCLKYLKIGL